MGRVARSIAFGTIAVLVLVGTLVLGTGGSQSACGATAADAETARGSALTLANMRQFPDYCTHVHVEVKPTSTDPLRVTE